MPLYALPVRWVPALAQQGCRWKQGVVPKLASLFQRLWSCPQQRLALDGHARQAAVYHKMYAAQPLTPAAQCAQGVFTCEAQEDEHACSAQRRGHCHVQSVSSAATCWTHCHA